MVDNNLIKKMVQNEFGIRDIGTKKRVSNIVHARWVYFKLARKYTNTSYASIGSVVNRDHATVLHGLKYIDYDMELPRFANVKEAYHKIDDFMQTGKKDPLKLKLVDLYEIKEHIKDLKARVTLLEYEKSKQNTLVED